MEVTQCVGEDQLNPLWIICSKLCMLTGTILNLNRRNRCAATSVLAVKIALACIIALRAAVNLLLNKGNPGIDVLNT